MRAWRVSAQSERRAVVIGFWMDVEIEHCN